MFSIFHKKNQPLFDFSQLKTDMHSHLVPGIDDGAPDIATSLQLITGLHNLGYKKIITTPHIMWDMYKNTPDIILPRYKKVKEEIKSNDISVEFDVAAEYFLDDHFEKLADDENSSFLTFHDNLILVEFSFVQEPIELKSILFKLQLRGYQPVIAHPERYLYFGAKKQWYNDMKEIGCFFQLNVLSLTGFYGKPAFELAQYLIKQRYYNLIGTDLHNNKHLGLLRDSSSYGHTIYKLIDSGLIFNAQL
ncbi:MAG: histidinol phosphatase [Bacteroidetes bacterium]|nr:histidinol phosphatase [Bacteroidota bacterium]MBS1973893.1 histidinol phosphatase [Bacteroidota bacterium]